MRAWAARGVELTCGVVPRRGADGAQASPEVAAAAAAYPYFEVYHGFRRDVVAVLGNCCYQRPSAVKELVGSGAHIRSH